MSEAVIKYYLILTRKRQVHVGHDTEIVELEGDSLEQARADADQQLRGDPEKWRSKAQAHGLGLLHVIFDLNPEGSRGTLLRPEFLPFETARIVQVVDERPSLEFYAEMKTWAAAEEKRVRAKFDADHEYQEFLRLYKKYVKDGGNGATAE